MSNERETLRELRETLRALLAASGPGRYNDNARLAVAAVDNLPALLAALDVLDAEVGLQGDRAEQAEILAQTLRAERDELAAEVAAYQGRPEGALNTHWTWQIGEGWIRRIDEKVILFADHSGWRVWRYTGISDLLDVNDCGNGEGFLNNMRAAEAAARARGLLPEGS